MEFGIIFLIVLILILLYLIGGGILEHHRIHVIHETGLGIIMGMVVGFIIYEIDEKFYLDHMIFEGDLFFYFILPPIIFAGGYNLKKRRFFSNFFYICLFGLLGTIVNFIVVWLITTGVNNAGWIRRYSDFDTAVTLETRDVLLFSATICATDSVAALAMIKSDTYPKLFSVIFGEGMVNDSVSIILYNSVLDLVGSSNIPKEISFTFSTFMLMIAEFLKNASASLAIGVAWGLFATLITKHFRFLSHNPVVETVVVLLFGFCSFGTSEILKLSGVISILVCGIVMSHYLFYNISSTGKVTTGVTFSSISTIAEAALYVYLGIICWQMKGGPNYKSGYAWSWTFLLIELGVAFLARFISIFCLSWIFMIIKGKHAWRLNRYELSVVWFAGIIRGAIAFALIQKVPGDQETSHSIQIIQSTTLFIVIVTTVVLGGLMPNYITTMLGQIKKTPRYTKDHPSIRDSVSAAPKPEKAPGTQQKFFKRFDELVIKKFFIYDYENRQEEIRIEKSKLKMNSVGFDAAVFLGQKKLEEEKHQEELRNSTTSNTSSDVSVVVDQESAPQKLNDTIELTDEKNLKKGLNTNLIVEKSINDDPEAL